MFRRISTLALVLAGSLCLAQTGPSGPIGRAIRATQVVMDPADMTQTSNSVLQLVLEDLDGQLNVAEGDIVAVDGRVLALESTRTTLTKGDTAVAGGHIVKDGYNYTIYFPPSGSGTANGTGYGTSTMPVGSLSMWTMDTNSIPTGWLLCDGSSYATNTYADLYAAIGFRYSAGIGATFKVPDLRGRVLRGADLGANVDPGHANRVASGFGGSAELAGSTQPSTFFATTNTTFEARMANTYVHFIIKAVDDMKTFMQDVVMTEGSSFAATNLNGTLMFTYANSTNTAWSPAWVGGGSSSSSQQSTIGPHTATYNQLVVAWYSDGDPNSGSNPTLLGYVRDTDGIKRGVARARMQTSDPYKDGDTTYCISFPCRRGATWSVEISGWRRGSAFWVHVFPMND